MYAKVDKFDKKVHIHVEDEDLCCLCVYTEECPLINALQDEVVVLRYENIEIEKCGMYKEFCFEEMIAF